MDILTLLQQRLLSASHQIPTGSAWGFSLVGLGLYALVALPWGWRGGLLRWEPVRSPAAIVSNGAIALVFPALVEEILFRVLPLPLPGSAIDPLRFWGWILGSLLVFIAAHPLNALIIFPDRKNTFFDPTFLTLAGLLGILCTAAYVQSGSLWPPVVLHWILVMVWLLLLGGAGRVGFVPPPAP